MSLIEIKGVSGGYGKRRVLRDVKLRLEGGELASLIGANGTGKSTFLKMLSGNLKPMEGEILIDGRNPAEIGRGELARLVSLVTTGRPADGMLRVEEVVEMGRYPYTGFMGRLDGEDRRMVERAMEGVRIVGLKGRRIGSLSDGERQKVMIARALAQATPVILLDEPTAFLDVASRIEVTGLLRELARDEGKGIVMSTHDIGSALQLSDVVWGLTGDGGVRGGSPGALISAQAAGEAGNLLDELFRGRRVRFDTQRGDYKIS